MTTIHLRNGDCVEVMRSMADGSVGAVVCDPPYDLTSVSRGGSSRTFVDNPYGRTRVGTDRGGFMGKTWDGTGIAFSPALWSEIHRVLKPGGVVKAFGGTRTFHRMTRAMREAGFVDLRLEAWTYGSGFPKSLNIGKAMDRSNGDPGRIRKFTAWMRTTGVKARLLDQVLRDAGLISPNSNFSVHFFNDNQPVTPSKAMWDVVRPLLGDIPPWVDEIVHRIEAERIKVGEREGTDLTVAPGQGLERSSRTLDITVSSTIVARAWEGWGTALKPAWEPVVVGVKP